MAERIFEDLREFIEAVKEVDRFKLVEGADWEREIGAATELQSHIPDSPLLLFDKIKGYPPGFRVASNLMNTPRRIALALGLPLEASGLDLVRAWRKRFNEQFKAIPNVEVKLDVVEEWRDRSGDQFRPLPPVEVSTGPVKENVQTGSEVDLFKFPTPQWHEYDGGRYIGTGNMVIMKDPDEGWVNLGCYRVQIYDKAVATIFISDSRHGSLLRQKYWDRGLACPAAVVCGQDPLLWFASTTRPPWGAGEYEYAGYLRGKPVQVVKGEVTGLPIPATAEIVLEGEIVPPGGETRIEGPMGEWGGYYSPQVNCEVFNVKAVLHRNNPIMTGAPVNIGPYDLYNGFPYMMAATIWDALDRQVAGVRGVWVSADARSTFLIIVSVKQMYPGHAKRVGMAAADASDRVNRFVIVVDDDIDPYNTSDVLWALGTRCNPVNSIDIIDGCWSWSADPLIPPEKRKAGEFVTSKAIIYACKPFHRKDDFPRDIKGSPELLQRVKEKFFPELL